MYDKTGSVFFAISKIELPPKMTKDFIKKLQSKHPQPLAINDSATYEYQTEGSSASH